MAVRLRGVHVFRFIPYLLLNLFWLLFGFPKKKQQKKKSHQQTPSHLLIMPRLDQASWLTFTNLTLSIAFLEGG
jgi:hypothetical protein